MLAARSVRIGRFSGNEPHSETDDTKENLQ